MLCASAFLIFFFNDCCSKEIMRDNLLSFWTQVTHGNIASFVLNEIKVFYLIILRVANYVSKLSQVSGSGE